MNATRVIVVVVSDQSSGTRCRAGQVWGIPLQ